VSKGNAPHAVVSASISVILGKELREVIPGSRKQKESTLTRREQGHILSISLIYLKNDLTASPEVAALVEEVKVSISCHFSSYWRIGYPKEVNTD